MKESVGRRTIALSADDFGMNAAVNAGIAAAFRRGLLTGASLLVNGPAAVEASEIWTILERERAGGALPTAEARRRLGEPDRPFDLGLHLNLTQGYPLTGDYPAELRGPDGTFCGVWRLARALSGRGARYGSAIEREIAAQLGRGRELGLMFGRVDGHQYVEMLPVVTTALVEQLPRFGLKHVRIARERRLSRTALGQGRVAAWILGLVKRRYAERFARRMEEAGFVGTDAFFGTAHAGRITSETLGRFVGAVGAGETAEIGLHPGETPAAAGRPGDPWFDPLADRRPRELAMLVSAESSEGLERLGARLGRASGAGGAP
jgi:predicted glycoside hydrolase/deacetylase ChbG (UPF0249 family)